jgi:hypothetical protein
MRERCINEDRFTLPANINYISDQLLKTGQFLDHPLPFYDEKNHSEMPPYRNPHGPPPGGMPFQAPKHLVDLLSLDLDGLLSGHTACCSVQ